jgi:hypothetical protein
LQRFHDLMLNETNADAIPALIDEEAGKLNLSAAQTQAFKDNVRMMYKHGSWKSGATYWETRAGWISLPVKSNGQIVPRGYVYSLFAEEVEGIDPGEIVSDASIELLRGEVRSADDLEPDDRHAPAQSVGRVLQRRREGQAALPDRRSQHNCRHPSHTAAKPESAAAGRHDRDVLL